MVEEKTALIEGFGEDCTARGLTFHTIESYTSNLKHFLRRYPDPSKITLDDLKQCLGELRARDLHGSTLKGYFASLSTFYDWLLFEGKVSANPILPFRKRYLAIKHQHGGENTRQLISIEKMRKLLNLIEETNIWAMVLFLAKTGLRRGELISMDIQDIDFELGTFWTKAKRKRTNRGGFLDPETTIALNEYLEWRENLAVDNALWIMPNGKRMTKNYVYYSVIRYASVLGIHDPLGPLNKKFTPHCCRHFFVTHLRRSGMSREFIKELRGDAIKDAIDIYDHIDPEELRAAYLRHIPQLVVYSTEVTGGKASSNTVQLQLTRPYRGREHIP